MIQFVAAKMNATGFNEPMQRAIAGTHTGYLKVGDLTQGQGWELYTYPIGLDRLLVGNSPEMSFEANEVIRLGPPLPPLPNLPPQGTVLPNKPKSTAGFSAYVAFVPDKGIGIVMLVNKNCPISVRVMAALAALRTLDGLTGGQPVARQN